MFDTATTTMTFGTRLRAARKRAGLPQDQLGFELGVSKGSVSAWETGRATPSFDLLAQIRKVTHTSLDELVCGIGSQPMFIGVAEPIMEYRSGVAASDPSEAELLKRFRTLPKIKRTALLELIR